MSRVLLTLFAKNSRWPLESTVKWSSFPALPSKSIVCTNFSAGSPAEAELRIRQKKR